MFKPSNQFDADFRISLLLCSIGIYDAETGLCLNCSRGSRRGGRPARYYVSSVRHNYFDCEKPFPTPRTMFWVERFGETYCELPRLTAYNDAEAVQKANRWLSFAAGDLSAEGARLLRDVLPGEAAEAAGGRVGKMLDSVVVGAYGASDGSVMRPWPGAHPHVSSWWALANGYAVGINEGKSVSIPAVNLAS